MAAKRVTQRSVPAKARAGADKSLSGVIGDKSAAAATCTG